ncbi:Fatty acid metabolism regulator protein [uncultured Clostridium sp.]|uniref:TetR/AcrR family transcriptional regulator n=1 Tax=uncultured Clostridium sp. TaxID=59620 RepID=UPI000822AAF5|nr:TetR/AcrR family transcriptional regulator [uncultured Clostridium sp.]SCI97357.1 Fatty acid metabolism regulator protein [uncultured Clostridium sp.]
MSKTTKKQTEKRNEIIEAAKIIMDEVGFENVTVRSICKAANISIGTFYHYFNDKGDIVIQLYTSVDEYLKEIETEKLSDEDELKNIITFSKEYGKFVSDSGLSVAKQIFSASINTESNQIYRSKERDINRIIFDIVKRAKDKNQINSEFGVEEISNMILITIRGIAFDWCKFHGQYDLAKQMENNISIFVNGIK